MADFLPPDSGEELKLYYAEVTGDDSDQPTTGHLNRIKFKISPYMDRWEIAHHPYALPFRLFNGGESISGMSGVPAVGSTVWVTHLHNKWHYVADARYDTNSVAKTYYDSIQSQMVGKLTVPVMPSTQYPDAITFLLPNNICIAYDKTSDAPAITVYHPSGSFSVTDADGNIGVYSVKDVELKTQDGVQFKTTGKDTFFTDGNANVLESSATNFKMTNFSGQVMDMQSGFTLFNNGKLKILS